MTEINETAVFKIKAIVANTVKDEIMRMSPKLIETCKRSVRAAKGRRS